MNLCCFFLPHWYTVHFIKNFILKQFFGTFDLRKFWNFWSPKILVLLISENFGTFVLRKFWNFCSPKILVLLFSENFETFVLRKLILVKLVSDPIIYGSCLVFNRIYLYLLYSLDWIVFVLLKKIKCIN